MIRRFYNSKGTNGVRTQSNCLYKIQKEKEPKEKHNCCTFTLKFVKSVFNTLTPSKKLSITQTFRQMSLKYYIEPVCILTSEFY